MTVTTKDLRDAMDAYVDDIRVPNSEATLAGVRSRVATDRRRGRTRLVAAVAAGVLVVGTAVGVSQVWPKQTLTPAEQVKKSGAHLPLFVGGYKLVEVREVPTSHGDPYDYGGGSQRPAAGTISDLGNAAGREAKAMVACADLLTSGSGMADTALLLDPTGSAVGCQPSEPLEPLALESQLLGTSPGGSLKVALVSANRDIRKKVPVGIYVPMKWGEQPATTATAAVTNVAPNTYEPGVIGASKRGKPSGVLTITVTPRVSGDYDLFANITSGSAGRFRARTGAVDLSPTSGAAATDGWSPIWVPNGQTLFQRTVRTQAGTPITVVIDSADNRADWLAQVALLPRASGTSTSTTA